jgi:hypothetical protein
MFGNQIRFAIEKIRGYRRRREEKLVSSLHFEGELMGLDKPRDVLTTVSRYPLPDNIGVYSGMWVAIRAGEVISASEDLDGLQRDQTDILYKVPPANTKRYY